MPKMTLADDAATFAFVPPSIMPMFRRMSSNGLDSVNPIALAHQSEA